MSLYRMVFNKGGRLGGITFAARSAEAARTLAESLCEKWKYEFLTVKHLRPMQDELRLS